MRRHNLELWNGPSRNEMKKNVFQKIQFPYLSSTVANPFTYKKHVHDICTTCTPPRVQSGWSASPAAAEEKKVSPYA